MSKYFIIIFLFYLFVTLWQSSNCMDSNVGTTLFTRADLHRECWSKEQIALLVSRMMLEDLMPNNMTNAVFSDEYILDLIEYYKLILEIIKEQTGGNVRHLTIISWCDILGGYLHNFILPITRLYFYSGLISFDTAIMLEELYQELKTFLRSNGEGWYPPDWDKLKELDVPQKNLNLYPTKDDIAYCRSIIFLKDHQKNLITVPLPFFDSIINPSAIAIPVITSPLHNLQSPNASGIVMKFFVSAYKCIQAKQPSAESLEKFKKSFRVWIENNVIPHLRDDKLYAAFGGILQVRHIIQRLNESPAVVVTTPSLPSSTSQNDSTFDTNSSVDIVIRDRKADKGRIIVGAILITMVVWFLLGFLFICYKMCCVKQTPPVQKHRVKQQPQPQQQQTTDYELSTAPTSITSSRYRGKKSITIVENCREEGQENTLSHAKRHFTRAKKRNRCRRHDHNLKSGPQMDSNVSFVLSKDFEAFTRRSFHPTDTSSKTLMLTYSWYFSSNTTETTSSDDTSSITITSLK